MDYPSWLQALGLLIEVIGVWLLAKGTGHITRQVVDSAAQANDVARIHLAITRKVALAVRRDTWLGWWVFGLGVACQLVGLVLAIFEVGSPL